MEIQNEQIIAFFQKRFEQNPQRHPNCNWQETLAKLQSSPEKLQSLQKMEETGGQPDLITFPNGTTAYVDCSPESPNRRSLCYDQTAFDSRKEHKPKNSAVTMASEIGIELLDEEQYAHLQTLGEFDLKTSSWLKTPESVRTLGGAIFGDRRFNRVFTYHNGAESYYAARGFRGILKI